LVTAQKAEVEPSSNIGRAEVPKASGHSPSFLVHKILWGFFVVFLFIVLYIISTFNYLLFHSLVELICVVVAVSIFTLAWHTRRYLDNSFLLFIGVAYLFTGGLDLVHTIAYKGMGILADPTANPSTQLWIGARYMQSLSLLAAPFFLHRRTAPLPLLFGYGSVSALLLASIMLWGVFPDCYISGQGLTPFKINSEYVISLILLCSIGTFSKNRREFAPSNFRWFILAIIFTIFSELAFTFYVSVFGLSNFVGHSFKLISCLFIYGALVASGLRKPYEELQVKEKGLSDVQRIAQLGSWEWNILNNAAQWSDEQFRIFGYEPGEIEPMYEQHFISALHPEDRDRVLETVKRTLDNSEPFDIEFRIILPDKSEKTISAQGEVVRNEAGEPERMIGTTLDITETQGILMELREKEQELLNSQSDLRKLAGRLLSAQEDERRRLARELHDDLTQRLAVLAIDAGQLRSEIRGNSKAADALEAMQGKLITISEDVHSISRQLHPSIIDDLGLEDALRSEINLFSRREGLPVTFESNLGSVNLATDIALCLFRITQESLHNIQKHARAKIVTIHMGLQNGSLLLKISDDGRGFDPMEVRKLRGLGLKSMRERMRLVNGSITYFSQPGQGTKVEARIDIPS
jgi:PAS domain S-box-containing protein